MEIYLEIYGKTYRNLYNDIKVRQKILIPGKTYGPWAVTRPKAHVSLHTFSYVHIAFVTPLSLYTDVYTFNAKERSQITLL